MTHTNIPCTYVTLRTPLEAVAVKMFYQELTITVCSLYLPNEGNFPTTDFKNLLDELPTPYLILGDYNSKSHRWGSPLTPNYDITYKRGEDLIKIVDDRSLNILQLAEMKFAC